MAEKTVDTYIAGLEDWKADVAVQIREIVKRTAPEAKESIKWAQPVYEVNGPFCYFKAFKSAVNFGFWRGAELDDPMGLLHGAGEKMRHVKLTSVDDIDEEALGSFVTQAVQLNIEKGDPTQG